MAIEALIDSDPWGAAFRANRVMVSRRFDVVKFVNGTLGSYGSGFPTPRRADAQSACPVGVTL